MKLLKIVLGIGAIVLIAVGLSFLVFESPLPFGGEDFIYERVTVPFSPTTEAIVELDVRVQNRYIVIQESADIEVISVELSNSAVDYLTVTVVDGVLEIREAPISWWEGFIAMFHRSNLDGLLEITVPDDYIADTINLVSMNGSITAEEGIEATRYIAITSNGAIEVLDMQADDLLLQSMNGALIMSHVTVTNTIELSTLNGLISLGDIAAESIDLHTSNGAVELEEIVTTELTVESFNGDVGGSKITATVMDASTSNGDISFDFEGDLSLITVEEVHLTTSNGSIYYNSVNRHSNNFTTEGSGTLIITCHTSNGSITLE